MRRRRQRAVHVPRVETADVWLRLDAALQDRLREALEPGRLVTEPELRRLADEGRACSLLIGGELARSEQRLAGLDADPASPLAEVATAFRHVNVLRAHLAELGDRLVALEERASELRASWRAQRLT